MTFPSRETLPSGGWHTEAPAPYIRFDDDADLEMIRKKPSAADLKNICRQITSMHTHTVGNMMDEKVIVFNQFRESYLDVGRDIGVAGAAICGVNATG